MIRQFMLALGLTLTAAGAYAQTSATRQAVAASEANASAMADQASATFNAAQSRAGATLATSHAAIQSLAEQADAKRLAYLQELYKKSLPPEAAAKTAERGTRILMFASKAMPDGDMRGLLQDALADNRITIVFLGGECEGGVAALVKWLGTVGRGLSTFPSIQIDPPSFHKFGITQVPYAVVLKDGKAVARVGGVYSTKWIDEQLRSRSGDLGAYGSMFTPVELDMQRYIEDRIKRFDWQGYIKQAVANFWRDQKMPAVPHASKDEEYRIDPTTTLSHDIRTPDGRILGRAGQKLNSLKAAPLTATILVIDAADPVQRSFAHEQVKAGTQGELIVMSTSVPATATDGWKTWGEWQEVVGAHLYIYSKAFADRLQLTGSPAIVTGDGTLLKVRQVALDKRREG